jgi:hypothetical protein
MGIHQSPLFLLDKIDRRKKGLENKIETLLLSAHKILWLSKLPSAPHPHCPVFLPRCKLTVRQHSQGMD